jgi:hypothetical protein
MKAEIFAKLTNFEREVYAKGLEAMGYEVEINQGWHDLNFSDVANPERIWGDRTMTVREWPTAQAGDKVVENGRTYIVMENVWSDGPSDRYTRRWALYARIPLDK